MQCYEILTVTVLVTMFLARSALLFFFFNVGGKKLYLPEEHVRT